MRDRTGNLPPLYKINGAFCYLRSPGVEGGRRRAGPGLAYFVSEDSVKYSDDGHTAPKEVLMAKYDITKTTTGSIDCWRTRQI
jgi:hypothetical protein